MACLDTSFLLDYAGRGGSSFQDRAWRKVGQLIASGNPLTTTRFNVAELEFDEPGARIFGRIEAHLRAQGHPRGEIDTLIASVAIVHSQAIVTRDLKHFEDIPGLDVELY